MDLGGRSRHHADMPRSPAFWRAGVEEEREGARREGPMTLVYDSRASQNEPTSVGTHVLVIGIGEYPHLDGGTGRRTPALPGSWTTERTSGGGSSHKVIDS